MRWKETAGVIRQEQVRLRIPEASLIKEIRVARGSNTKCYTINSFLHMERTTINNMVIPMQSMGRFKVSNRLVAEVQH